MDIQLLTNKPSEAPLMAVWSMVAMVLFNILSLILLFTNYLVSVDSIHFGRYVIIFSIILFIIFRQLFMKKSNEIYKYYKENDPFPKKGRIITIIYIILSFVFIFLSAYLKRMELKNH